MASANSLFDIAGHVIVVTGATGVLAGSAARYLLSQGATVVLLGRRADAVAAMVASCRESGGAAHGCVCDVLDRDGLEKAAAEILSEHGRVDALVNGAGGNMPGAMVNPGSSVFDLKLDEYNKVLDLNLRGTLLPTLVFGRSMVARKSGSVVNFSSMAATQAITRGIGYSNAKGGIDNLTRWLAMQLARESEGGVRVNAVAPGFFVSNQNRALLLNPDGTPTERGRQVIAKTPMGRFGEASEINGCVHYLLSGASSFVTGSIVSVDGGFSSFSGV